MASTVMLFALSRWLKLQPMTSVEGVESVDNRPDIVDTFLSEFSLDSLEQRFCSESLWHGLAYQML
jgi:hypothetical protein